MDDEPTKTYSLRPVRPPRYVIVSDLLILAKAGMAYGLGFDRVALSLLLAWAAGTAFIVVLVARDVRKNRRHAALLEARGFVKKPWQDDEER
ncbi:hypothetical protein [Actinomadura litoris]|uniref:hypothetical protein n=1 Tax=Actinomadura litoris TaxID=2678616 RepID=UPI001FA6B881|nr:hypothetical protein [Actinomadura litoris]